MMPSWISMVTLSNCSRRVQGCALYVCIMVLGGIGLEKRALASQHNTLEHWWNRIHQELATVIAKNEIIAPVPVRVVWKPSELWMGVLQGELVDVQGADIDGDGRSELLALTSQELVVFAYHRGLWTIRYRQALLGKAALIGARDAIGALEVHQNEAEELIVRVRSSDQALGVTFVWKGGRFQSVTEFEGFPLCQKDVIQSWPGRNVLDGGSIQSGPFSKQKLSESLYSLECNEHGVDRLGRPAHYFSSVSSAGAMKVVCAGDEEHCVKIRKSVSKVGDTHLIEDVNHDGYPEMIVSGVGVRGRDDSLRVLSHKQSKQKAIFETSFSGGIVGITSGDFVMGGATEVIVAVRHWGSRQVALWLLN